MIGAEQSNTSIVYGDSVILKVYRRIEPGENPDLEVHRALHAAGSKHIADPVGELVGTVDGQDTTLGMVTDSSRTAPRAGRWRQPASVT